MIGSAIDDAVRTLSFQNLEARVSHVTLLAPGRRMAAHQELEALPQRVQSPRYVIADAVGYALQGIPVVWLVIARATDTIWKWWGGRNRKARSPETGRCDG